ncbi:MFS transporter [Mycena venus]|uniref:MFS transporter n=1 Tax=Mycena venus TaxID=2733690 RepID=A0A8H7CHN3_9AGAR|nr:MFS transporter [Mycena venus]
MIDDLSSPLSQLDADSDWYDPKESALDLEHPKYFCIEHGEVIVGIKQRKSPIKLDTLCGTYRWFYEFPEPGISEPGEISYQANLRPQESPGYLTITCPKNARPTLKNITGTVMHFGKEARFSGIKRAKDQDSKSLVDCHWEFVSFKWKENYDDTQDDGNSILALEVSDDDGEPFVMFRCASPAPELEHMWYLDIAAKKERPGQRQKGYGLSAAEMGRLGMGGAVSRGEGYGAGSGVARGE